jgi:hypothetical protein
LEHLLKLGEITDPAAPDPNRHRHQSTQRPRRRIQRAPSRDGAQIVRSGCQHARVRQLKKARGHRSREQAPGIGEDHLQLGQPRGREDDRPRRCGR